MEGQFILKIGEKPETMIRENQRVYIKKGRIYDDPMPDFDAFVEIKNGECFIQSPNSYVEIPKHSNGEPYAYYIDTNLYENELSIGKSIVNFNLSNGNSKYELYVKKRNLKLKVKGVPQNLNDVLLLSKNSKLFQFIGDNSISGKHCYIGYDNHINAFFVIDYGSNGKGSTNGTYVKMKNLKFQVRKHTIFRINYEATVNYTIELKPVISPNY